MIKKNIKFMNGLFVIIISIFFLNTSCYKEEVIVENNGVTPGEGLADWTSETHSSEALSDYDIVFPQDNVNRIDVVISTDNWNTMLQDLTDNIGPFGSGGDMPPPPMFFASEMVIFFLFTIS